MKPYPLGPLLAIFQMRQDKAQRAVLLAHKRLLAAIQALRKAQATLQQYKAQWPREEAALFAKMVGTVVDRKEMARFKQQEKAFRDKEDTLEAKAMDCAKAREDAHKAHLEARETLRKAQAKLEKFQIQADDWNEAQHLEEERLMEKEMEDLNLRRQDQWARLSF